MNVQPVHVAALVLAAGMSRRMGRPKLLLPLGEGTVLDRVLRNLREAGGVDPIIVVTGAERSQVEAVAQAHGAATIHNQDYEAGEMLSSVKTGVSALPADSDAFLVVLGDQPLVRPGTLDPLIAAWREERPAIVIPVFEGRRGHPILFDARCREAILALPGTATLRDAVKAHTAETVTVPVADRYILTDLDTPDDYAALNL